MINQYAALCLKRVRSCLIRLMGIVLVLLTCCSPSISLLDASLEDQGIEVRQGDARVLFYQVKPKSLAGSFARASYIHPLYTLDGNSMTEDFPEDHPHHHGVYSAWHQVIANDTLVGDGWTGENIWWEVVDTNVAKANNQIVVQSNVLWKARTSTQEEEAIMEERLSVTVHERRDNARLIDYDFVLSALKEGVKIGGSVDEKGYGGFSLRLKLPDDVIFQAESGAVQPQVVSVNAGPWMNFKGSFDGPAGGQSGIAVLSHPSNPGHPQPWILRRKESMQNAAFPGRVPASVTADGLRFRYRLIVYNGELEKSAIQKMYDDYSAN